MRRICFIGASTVEGMGDESGLGWPGRLWRAHQGTEQEFISYNLGIRGQTLHQIRKRAQSECAARIQKTMGPLIILGTGANDLSRFSAGDYAGKLRTPHKALARTFETLLAELATLAPVLVIGPAPIEEAQMPYRLANQMEFEFSNADIDAGTMTYADICDRSGVPFMPLYQTLKDDPAYARALSEGDGLHPTGADYQACADAIANWGPWKTAITKGWA